MGPLTRRWYIPNSSSAVSTMTSNESANEDSEGVGKEYVYDEEEEEGEVGESEGRWKR